MYKVQKIIYFMGKALRNNLKNIHAKRFLKKIEQFYKR